MQVPNLDPLSQSVARHGHLVKKLIERRTAEVDGILNLSHPGHSVKFLKMTWKKLDCSASQVGGADNIFCELFGDQKAKNSFWLDSSSIEKVFSSLAFSFITIRDNSFCLSLHLGALFKLHQRCYIFLSFCLSFFFVALSGSVSSTHFYQFYVSFPPPKEKQNKSNYSYVCVNLKARKSDAVINYVVVNLFTKWKVEGRFLVETA